MLQKVGGTVFGPYYNRGSIDGACGARGTEETGRKIVANRWIPGKALLYMIHGGIIGRPGRHTLQVGEREHIVVDGEARYLNHSFTPNAHFEFREEGVSAVSSRSISPGEPVTVDYNTTEWEIAEPFEDKESGARVAGFSKLEEGEQLRILCRAAPYIKAKFFG